MNDKIQIFYASIMTIILKNPNVSDICLKNEILDFTISQYMDAKF